MIIRKTSLIRPDKEDNLLILTKGASINLIGTLIHAAFFYGYALVIARAVGASAFGAYSLGLALITILSIFCEMGLGKAIIKYFGSFKKNQPNPRLKNSLDSVLFTGALISLCVAFMIFIFAGPISTSMLQDAHFTSILRFFTISIPLVVICNILISFTMARKTMRYKLYFKDSMRPFLELIIAILLLGFGLGMVALAISYTISYFLVTVMLFFLSKRLMFSRYNASEIPKMPYSLLKFSIPIMGGDLLMNLLPRITTFIIAIALSSKMLGIYNVVLRISTIHVLFIMSFSLIFAPIISELYANHDIKQLEMLFKQITTWTASLCAPILGAFLLFPSFVLKLFGAEFTVGCLPLIILSIGQLVNVFTGPVMYILIMAGHSKEYFMITFATTLLSCVLGLIFIFRFGLLGAALADAVTIVVMNCTMLITVYKVLNIHPYNKSAFIALSALFTAGLAAYLIVSQALLSLPFSAEVTGSIVFVAIYSAITISAGLYRSLFRVVIGLKVASY